MKESNRRIRQSKFEYLKLKLEITTYYSILMDELSNWKTTLALRFVQDYDFILRNKDLNVL